MRALVILGVLLCAVPARAQQTADDRAIRDERRQYHEVAIAEFATATHTHVRTTGVVAYVRREADGDVHLRIEDGGAFIVAEIIPELPMTVPRRGEYVMVGGIRRYDDELGHGWYEIHPVEAIEIFASRELTSPARAQEHQTAVRASMVAAIVAHSMDLAETEHCLGAHKCTEMNPFLVRFTSPSGFAVAKMGVASLTLWGVAKIAELKPRLAILVNCVTAGAFAGIAVHNAKVTK